METKRRAVIRDWFKLVLWFVRLRKAAKRKGEYIPVSLLEVEERRQQAKTFNGLQRVRQAKLRDYVENYGTDGEESSEIEDPMKELYPESEFQADDITQIDDNTLLEYNQEQMDNHLDKTRKMMGSNQNLRAFL